MSSPRKRKIKIIISDDNSFGDLKTKIKVLTIKKYTYKFHNQRILFYYNGAVIARKKIPEDIIRKLDENIHRHRMRNMSSIHKKNQEDSIKFILELVDAIDKLSKLLIKYPNVSEINILIQLLNTLKDTADYHKEYPENGGITNTMRQQFNNITNRIAAIKFMNENFNNSWHSWNSSKDSSSNNNFREDIPLSVNYLDRSYNKWYYENIKFVEESKSDPNNMPESWQIIYKSHLVNGENIKRQLDSNFFGNTSVIGPFTLLANNNINSRRDWKLWMLKHHSDKNLDGDSELPKLVNAAVSLVYPDRPME